MSFRLPSNGVLVNRQIFILADGQVLQQGLLTKNYLCKNLEVKEGRELIIRGLCLGGYGMLAATCSLHGLSCFLVYFFLLHINTIAKV